MKRDIVVGVLACRNADLVRQSLLSIATSKLDGERKVSCVCLVDSPEDRDLVAAAEREVVRVGRTFPITTIVTDRELDFVGSANRIFDQAAAEQSDAVLLSPGTVLFPNTLKEVISVAEADPMIGFACPRSNAGALSKLPLPRSGADDDKSLAPEIAFSAFESVVPHLPRKTYVPTVDGPCLLVKLEMLRHFGGFGLVGGPVMAGNDLIPRANRYGYLAAIANHAFAFAAIPASDPPDARAKWESGVTHDQYPHYHAAVSRYYSSAAYRALHLVATLAEKPLPIAFDLSNFRRHQDGTTEYGTKLVASFARRFKDKYAIHAICEPFVWKHHELNTMDGLIRSPVDADTLFPAIIRLGQPFDLNAVSRVASRGAVTIVTMLDSIAYDCLHICPPELEAVWKFTLGYSDVVIFPSEFSRARFAGRFPGASHGHDVVSVPSTDIGDYKPSRTIGSAGDYLLVVGNSLAHKAVDDTVDAIRHALPAEPLKVLGNKLARQPGLTSYQSGALSPAFVEELFANAKAVIFPSHYEGFGFPLMHALGNQKPVFVRDLPVYGEIRQRVSSPDNIHAFGTHEEMVNMLRQEFRWDETRRQVGDVGWDRAAGELEAALAQALSDVTIETIEGRLDQLDLLKEAFGGSQARVSQLEDQIKGLQTSTSWRLTAPLRKLKMLFS